MPDGRETHCEQRDQAQLAGTLLILFCILIFATEVTTEIDGTAGLVRIRGRRFVPPRRWSLERPIAEVAAVEVDTRGWGRERSFTVFLRFKDGSTALVLSPVSGWTRKIDGWTAELKKALGLPPPAAS